MIKRIYFEITQACNLNCRYCFVNKDLSSKILKLEEIINILNQAKKYHPIITFSGSEPLMYPDLKEVLLYSKGLGLFTEIYTNGTLIDKKFAEFLVINQIDNIRVSLDGPSKINDYLRKKGSYTKIVNAIKTINFYKKKYCSNLPYITLSPVISKKNLESLDFLITLAKKLKINRVHFLSLIWLNKKLAVSHIKELKTRLKIKDFYAEHLINHLEKLNPDKYREKIKEIKLLAKKNGIIVDFWQSIDRDDFADYWYSSKIKQKNIRRCGYIYDTVRIDQEGTVISCPLIRYPYGNLKKESLEKIWSGNKAKFFRNEITKNGLFPICYKCHRVLIE